MNSQLESTGLINHNNYQITHVQMLSGVIGYKYIYKLIYFT